jgi:phosphoenolpyruvate carboxykinase (GTP)
LQGVAIESPLGWMPRYQDMDWTGSSFPESKFIALQSIKREEWYKEMSLHNDHFLRMYDRLPVESNLSSDFVIFFSSSANCRKR